MSDDIEFLKDLPKFKARASFEDALLGDALGQMPQSAPETSSPAKMPQKIPQKIPPQKSVTLWASLAMAASLALGLWIGVGQGNVANLGTTTDASFAELNIYQDMLTEISS